MGDLALREYAGERAVAMLADVLYTSQRETIRLLLVAAIGLGVRRLQVPLGGGGHAPQLLRGVAALVVSLSTMAYGGAPGSTRQRSASVRIVDKVAVGAEHASSGTFDSGSHRSRERAQIALRQSFSHIC